MIFDSLLVKPVSATCNLACDYCFYLGKAELYPDQQGQAMSDEVLEALIRQAMTGTTGPVNIAWQGGEPILAGLGFFERVVELEQKHGRPGQVVSNAIQTDGLLLDEKWARFLRRYRFLVGLSLDGPAELHDAHRLTRDGRPTFELIYPKIELLRDHGVTFNLLAVVNDVTVRHPEALFRFCLDSGVGVVQLIPAVEFTAGGQARSFSVLAHQYGAYLCRIFDLWLGEDGPPGRPPGPGPRNGRRFRSGCSRPCSLSSSRAKTASASSGPSATPTCWSRPAAMSTPATSSSSRT